MNNRLCERIIKVLDKGSYKKFFKFVEKEKDNLDFNYIINIGNDTIISYAILCNSYEVINYILSNFNLDLENGHNFFGVVKSNRVFLLLYNFYKNKELNSMENYKIKIKDNSIIFPHLVKIYLSLNSIMYNDLEFMKTLFDMNIIKNIDNNFKFACRYNKKDHFKYLLDKGANLFEVDGNGSDALYEVCFDRYIDIIKIILNELEKLESVDCCVICSKEIQNNNKAVIDLVNMFKCNCCKLCEHNIIYNYSLVNINDKEFNNIMKKIDTEKILKNNLEEIKNRFGEGGIT